MKFFEHLDSKGGFYYERWGDAPVHSIGVALLAPKEKIHFFEDIGYRHEPFQHCPQGSSHKKGKCYCNVDDNFGQSCSRSSIYEHKNANVNSLITDYEWYSCLNKYDALFK